MTNANDARRIVLQSVSMVPSEQLPLQTVLGRFLAEDIVAPHAVPRFDNSGMDGYAVRTEDLAENTKKCARKTSSPTNMITPACSMDCQNKKSARVEQMQGQPNLLISLRSGTPTFRQNLPLPTYDSPCWDCISFMCSIYFHESSS